MPCGCGNGNSKTVASVSRGLDRCNTRAGSRPCNNCSDVLVLKFFVSFILLILARLSEKLTVCLSTCSPISSPILEQFITGVFPIEPTSDIYGYLLVAAPVVANIVNNILCALFKSSNVAEVLVQLNAEVSNLCDAEVSNCLCKLLGLTELVLDAVSGLIVCCEEVL